uniref:NADH-ubiquinone oxidoreductase chain 6 n=1 Tax=Balclutha sp. EMHAU-2015-Zz052711 TaxID=2036851 RepID=A0A343K1B0_9HEMI|nr:NADH dehydrogenase subunit 6 [Balclutha sp. EMHAU-2015-Zz052711]
MKMLFIKIMFLISSSICFMKTPMSLGVMLMIQTFICSIFMSKILSSSWVPMVMFLMLIGGLLILFMYMSSIASNEKFKLNFNFFYLIFIMLLPIDELFFDVQINSNLVIFMSLDSYSMSKIYNKGGFMITLFMFCYLLLTMIAVTKIVKVYSGPLRSK